MCILSDTECYDSKKKYSYTHRWKPLNPEQVDNLFSGIIKNRWVYVNCRFNFLGLHFHRLLLDCKYGQRKKRQPYSCLYGGRGGAAPPQAPYLSLPRKWENSLILLRLLSPTNPLRWASSGARNDWACSRKHPGT